MQTNSMSHSRPMRTDADYPNLHKTIAVDFDGTIHDQAHPVPGRRMGPPIPGALEAVQTLVRLGFTVVVFTAQVNHGYIRDWLAYYGFPALLVTNLKPVAAVYIDDRAVHFTGNWLETMKVVQDVLS